MAMRGFQEFYRDRARSQQKPVSSESTPVQFKSRGAARGVGDRDGVLDPTRAMSTVKFCVVGPKGSGKTTLCKLLAETDPDASYVPTEGVRIQEVERRVGMTPVTVQLWDCSGDFKYQNCFPAISLDAVCPHRRPSDVPSDVPSPRGERADVDASLPGAFRD